MSRQDRGISYISGQGSGVFEHGYLDRGTGKHQSNMVYDANGIMPTQYAVQYKEPFKVVVDE